MRITVISDTHTKHDELSYDPKDLPGGDLLIHAGDLMNSGYGPKDITNFCKWFDGLEQYDTKVFIAGNHDRMFENVPEQASEIYTSYKNITYLQDDRLDLWDEDDQQLVIYGAPWQPEFYSWAFNLPKGGPGLASKWEAIPKDTDILVTHGPPQDHLDMSGPPYNEPHLGCALLREKVDEQPPKIHVFGHIHGGYGYKFHNGTHFFNASILNERYEYVNRPVTFDWDPETNEITFL
jgi:3',5'-cyclic AMP phosphodiesterase CpdA